MSDLLYFAEQYADYGLAVFPVKKDKSPYVKNGFYQATTDHKIIKEWWNKWPDAGIAMPTGQVNHGIFVVDQDEKNGEHGIEEFEQWVDDNLLYFDDTWVAKTPSGGRHTYFKTNEKVNNPVGWLSGVDVRGDGGYVLLPPSVGANGSSYEWVRGPNDQLWPNSIEENAYISDLVYEINNSKKNSTSFSAPETVITGHRNDTLYKLACSLQAKGLADAAIMAAVSAENQEKCQPPLEDDEIRKLVQSALTKEKGVPEKTDLGEQPVPAELQDLRKATDLMKEDLPDLKVFIGVGDEVPFLVEGTCVLSAKSKLGKSWLSMELCNAISKGIDFLGYKTHQCSTLYLDLETHKNLKQKRLKKLTGIMGSISEKFYIMDSANLLGGGLEEEINHFLQQDPDIGVIVIDVFQKVLDTKKQRHNEKDYDFLYEQIGKLNKIAEEHHISIILVSHDRKTVDPGDPFSNILGSTALQGATDQMIVMYKKNFKDPITYIAVKGRTIDGLIDMTAQMENGLWTRAENVAEIRQLDAWRNSPILAGVKRIMQDRAEWKGRCSQFKNECHDLGIDLELPTDKNGDEDLRVIGAAFNNSGFKEAALECQIEIEKLDVKTTGGKIYRFHRYAPLNFEDLDVANPFET